MHRLAWVGGLVTASSLVSLLLVACGDDDGPPPAPSGEATAPQDVPEGEAAPGREARAREAVRQLKGTLEQRLSAALTEGGAAQAVEVCATEAQELGKRVSEETGVRVGRSSLRLRNPDNEGPPWVEAWLREQGERPAAGVEPRFRVEEGEARFVAPIPVEALCLNCHGPVESIPEEVRAVLSERYPQDRATGYALGDLRGAVWAASR